MRNFLLIKFEISTSILISIHTHHSTQNLKNNIKITIQRDEKIHANQIIIVFKL